MVEQIHKVIHNMMWTVCVTSKSNLDKDFRWDGILSAVCMAVQSTVHTTTQATPSQLVFGCDTVLNVSFEANWQCIKD